MRDHSANVVADDVDFALDAEVAVQCFVDVLGHARLFVAGARGRGPACSSVVWS